MGKNLGFFEKRRLGKKMNSFAVRLPFVGYMNDINAYQTPRYRESYFKYLEFAKECGIKDLLRVAETFEELPSAMIWTAEFGTKKYILMTLCLIGLSELMNSRDLSNFLMRLDSINEELAVDILSRVDDEDINKYMMDLMNQNERRKRIATKVLSKKIKNS